MTSTKELIRRIEKYLENGADYDALPMTREEYTLCLEALKLKDGESSEETEEVPQEDMADFAGKLNGIEYLEEREDTWKEAKKKGYVVVFGYSDDNIEFRGAIDDEIGAFQGKTVFLDNGNISMNADSRYYIHAAWYGTVGRKKILNTYQITDENGDLIPWTYSTNIPHEEFTMYEDGDPFCRGIVFSIDSIKG